jgi:hypothetical protein
VNKKNVVIAASVLALLSVAFGSTTATATTGARDAAAVQEGSADADRGPVTRNGTAYVGGGTWSYGVWSGEVHSGYAHPRSTHRASVQSHGVVARSAWVPPTAIAHAHRPAAVSGNQAFWATRG